MVQVVFTSAGTTEQGMMAWADSSTAHLVCPEFQGTLSVMLICTVLELCLAWLAAVVWWKQARSDFTGVSVLATRPPPLPESCQGDLRFWAVLSICKGGRGWGL